MKKGRSEPTTIKLKPQTILRLQKVKSRYNFRSHDAVISALLNNLDSFRLEVITKKEVKENGHSAK